jgi:hypothetical protein
MGDQTKVRELLRKEKEMKPDCYKCVHRLNISGDAHSRCNNFQAKIKGNDHGIRNGWFRWPLNFDPIWLISCDGFSGKQEDKKPKQKLDPLIELMGMLR